MIHPSTQKLINRLSEMTVQGRIDWAEGDNETIIYETEGYRVTLLADPEELLLTDIHGKELEHVTAEELAGATAETGDTFSLVLSDMRREAARVARGTEEAISRVLAGLELSAEPAVPADVAPVEAALSDEPLDIEEPIEAEAVPTDDGAPANELAEGPDALDADAASMTVEVAKLADEVNGQNGLLDDDVVDTDDATDEAVISHNPEAEASISAADYLDASPNLDALEDISEVIGAAKPASSSSETETASLSMGELSNVSVDVADPAPGSSATIHVDAPEAPPADDLDTPRADPVIDPTVHEEATATLNLSTPPVSDEVSTDGEAADEAHDAPEADADADKPKFNPWL